MKKLVLISIASLFASSVYAADFRDIKVSEINNVKIDLPAAPSMDAAGTANACAGAVSKASGQQTAKCGHVSGEITKLHFLAQTAKSLLYTYADTEALFNEFTGMWKPILQKFGLTPTTTEYKNRFGTLNYTSPEDRVVRDFMADGLNYNALDANEIARLQHSLLEPLEQAGMTPIASFTIKHEVFRPTFNIYYLTKQDENPDHEIRLRQLKNGNDIDFALLKEAGVRIVREDASFSAVYIGKLVGFKSKVAADEASANAKLEEYKKFLVEQKKEFIGARIAKLDEPFTVGETTYTYYVSMYFYQ
ncbi:MAG: hypothetical protein KKH28_01735 [Elusimicrobia bacterium]|nr:hypothetical protein [Elusimicrobiota bacterium]